MTVSDALIDKKHKEFNTYSTEFKKILENWVTPKSLENIKIENLFDDINLAINDHLQQMQEDPNPDHDGYTNN